MRAASTCPQVCRTWTYVAKQREGAVYGDRLSCKIRDLIQPQKLPYEGPGWGIRIVLVKKKKRKRLPGALNQMFPCTKTHFLRAPKPSPQVGATSEAPGGAFIAEPG